MSKAVAVIHDLPSGPETSISEICPVAGSNPIVPETQCIIGEALHDKHPRFAIHTRKKFNGLLICLKEKLYCSQ